MQPVATPVPVVVIVTKSRSAHFCNGTGHAPASRSRNFERSRTTTHRTHEPGLRVPAASCISYYRRLCGPGGWHSSLELQRHVTAASRVTRCIRLHRAASRWLTQQHSWLPAHMTAQASLSTASSTRHTAVPENIEYRRRHCARRAIAHRHIGTRTCVRARTPPTHKATQCHTHSTAAHTQQQQ